MQPHLAGRRAALRVALVAVLLATATARSAVHGDASLNDQATPFEPLNTLAQSLIGESSAVRIQPDGSLVVEGLRFAGALEARWAPGGGDHWQAAPLESLAPLEFEQEYAPGGSWTVTLGALPGGAPARVVVWCQACTSGQQRVQGAVAAAPLASPAGTGMVVLVLRGAALEQQQQQQQQQQQGRALLQSASCSLDLAVGGTTYSFDHCEDLTSTVGATYQLLYTLEASGTGSLFKGGLRASTSGGWAGLGWTSEPGTMVGSDSVILSPTATGAAVGGYHLSSESAGTINAAKGTVPLTDTAAGTDTQGNLVAVFSRTLPQPPAQLSAAATDLIFAIGTMASDGSLATHVNVNSPYGPLSVRFQASAASVASPSPATAASPSPQATPSPTPSPAAEGQATTKPGRLPIEGQGREGEDTGPKPLRPKAGDGSPPPAKETTGTDQASGATPVASGTSPAPKQAQAADASPAPTPAALGGAGGNCSLSIGGSNTEYGACSGIGGIGNNYQLYWTVEPVANNPAKSLLTMALSATSTGYVAVGWPTTPGKMVGASSMILKADSNAPSGASVVQYYLAGKTESTVQPGGILPVSNLQAEASGGQLAGTFQMEIDTPAAAAGGMRRLLAAAAGSSTTLPLIFAAGDVSPSGAVLEHADYGSNTIDLSSSGSSSTASGGDSAATIAMVAAHGWLMTIGWGVFIPSGIVMARSFKDTSPPMWFHVHRAVQTLGLIMGIVGIVLGFEAAGGWDTPYTVHRNLGVAVTVLGVLQLSALAWRPQKGQKYRFAWEMWHHWVGRAAAAGAIANIYYGIINVEQMKPWAWATYTAVLAVIVGVSVGKDTATFLRNRRRSQQEPPSSKHPGDASVDDFVRMEMQASQVEAGRQGSARRRASWDTRPASPRVWESPPILASGA